MSKMCTHSASLVMSNIAVNKLWFSSCFGCNAKRNTSSQLQNILLAPLMEATYDVIDDRGLRCNPSPHISSTFGGLGGNSITPSKGYFWILNQ